MVSKPWMKCPLSGATENLLKVKLIPYDFVDTADETVVTCMEWFWGLKRGGLHYHLATAHNSLFLREDIAHLYASFQFILAPTHATHLRIMDFAKRSGVMRRNSRDKSFRRPLTALTPPSGFFRYVFIPFTDAARKLQEELNLQPQTEEDLAGGIDPIWKTPLLEGSEKFPVVECYGHPYSVCTLARQAFKYHNCGTLLTSQWNTSAIRICGQWEARNIRHVPQWFIDAPDMELDDITMGTSGEGYTISSRSAGQEDRPRAVYEDEEILEANVSGWAQGVDPDSRPEEQPPVPRSPLQVRRSERLKKKAHPYGSRSPVFAPLSPVRKAPWPCEYDADPATHPPNWVARNGRYPTRRFSSNDWAYFCYSVALAAPLKS
ncbi:hypothetical protein HDZ31DRAFT_40937 [Schizophyllum fasciatum]